MEISIYANDPLYKAAVQLLSTAKSVYQWNEIMSVVKDSLPVPQVADIEASGLIVKVLGPDKKIISL